VRSSFVVNVVLALFAVSAVARPGNHQDKNVPSHSETVPAFSQYTTAHFTIIHDIQPAQAQTIADFLEQTYTRFFAFFEEFGFNPSIPDQRLNWVCFSNSENFDEYFNQTDNMNLPRLSSYYSAKTNRVAILLPPFGQNLNAQHNVACDANSAGNIIAASNNDYQQVSDARRIGHELAHQLAFNTGLQKRKVMYPLWVSEGLATVFEMQLNSSGRDCQLFAKDNAVNKLIPLVEFIPMTQLPADSALHPYVYAQAQALFDFLMIHRRDQLRTYMKTLHEVEPGRRLSHTILAEFTDVFGSVNNLQKEWDTYVSTSATIASATH
jgi:hypothetical protein